MPEKFLNNVQTQINDVVASLPDDASWDDIWQHLIVTSVQVSSQPAVESTESLVCENSVANNGIESPLKADGTTSGKSFASQTNVQGHQKETALHEPDSGADEDVTNDIRKKGIRLKITSFVVLVAGIAVTGLLDSFMTEINQTHKILINVYVVVLIYLTYRIHKAGRYYTQKAEELVTIDNRAPVVYLRSFAADPMTTKVRVSSITEEEQIVGILKTIGPVISLDNPVTEISAPGARRISVRDQEWQNRVLGLMQKARLVVIRLGDTPSLYWEIAQARRMLKPEKLVFIVPLQKLFDYKRFKTLAERELSIRIQSADFSESVWQVLIRLLTRGRRFQEHYSFQGFMYFDNEWNGKLASPRFTWKGYMHSPLTQPGRADITYALGPVFERVGVPEPALQLNWFLLTLVIAIGGGGVIGMLAHMFGSSL